MSAPASKYYVAFLAAGMLIAGCAASESLPSLSSAPSPLPKMAPSHQPSRAGLLIKGQDRYCVTGCKEDDDRPYTTFSRLVFFYLSRWQARRSAKRTALVKIKRSTEAPVHPNENVALLHAERVEYANESAVVRGEVEEVKEITFKQSLLFILPVLCDICGTTAMNLGLVFVNVSVYQMLKGALTLWVALLSFVVLRRKLTREQLVALVLLMLGVAIVGLSASRGKKHELETTGHETAGVVLILLAQFFIAFQFVVEERLMEWYPVLPMQSVGFEGAYGLVAVCSIIYPILYVIFGRTPAGHGGAFDAVTQFWQIVENPPLQLNVVALMLSIAILCFCGLGVTRSVSATARSTVDTCRTILIWIVSLLVGWEVFRLEQLVGFIVLMYGTLVFNGVTSFPKWMRLGKTDNLVPQDLGDADSS